MNSINLIISLFLGFANLNDCGKAGLAKTSTFESNKASDKIYEDFTIFLKKFSTDPTFQLTRISFPLKLIVSEEDVKQKKYILKAQWKFTNLLKLRAHKGILKQIKVSQNIINLEYTVEDTGILVNHYFTKINGLWSLTSILDESD